MSDQATPVEKTVQDFFAALGSQDWSATRELMDDDITWTVMCRGVPGAGAHQGADAIFSFIKPVRELFAPGSPTIEVRSMVASGSMVIMETHGGGLLKDGRIYDNNYVMVLEVKDGRILALREYMDSHYVHELLSGA